MSAVIRSGGGLGRAALVLVVAALCGCASSPPSAAPTAPAAAHPAAPAAKAAQAPPTSLEVARHAGYQQRQINGKTMYCKEVSQSGSRLQRETVCLTDEELKAQEALGAHEASKMQRTLPREITRAGPGG